MVLNNITINKRRIRMERRTLLRNLLSSVVVVPVIGAFETRAIASAEGTVCDVPGRRRVGGNQTSGFWFVEEECNKLFRAALNIK